MGCHAISGYLMGSKKILAGYLMLLLTTTVFADVVLAQAETEAETETEDKPISTWNGEAELGYVMTSGNSDTDSLNVRFRIENKRRFWWHKFHADALRSTDDDKVTARNYSALLRTEYLRTQKDYLFASLRQESDTFAGYDSRQTGVGGYGFRWGVDKPHQLDLEAGAGARRTDYTEQATDSEGIFRLAANYRWIISPTSEFSEELSTEIGEDNTYTESETSLKVKINSALAMKLNLTIKDNSKVLDGNKHTDTKTSVTLAYDF